MISTMIGYGIKRRKGDRVLRKDPGASQDEARTSSQDSCPSTVPSVLPALLQGWQSARIVILDGSSEYKILQG